jgi:hypothetical protein
MAWKPLCFLIRTKHLVRNYLPDVRRHLPGAQGCSMRYYWLDTKLAMCPCPLHVTGGPFCSDAMSCQIWLWPQLPFIAPPDLPSQLIHLINSIAPLQLLGSIPREPGSPLPCLAYCGRKSVESSISHD